MSGHIIPRPCPKLPRGAAPRPIELPAAERYKHAEWLEDDFLEEDDEEAAILEVVPQVDEGSVADDDGAVAGDEEELEVLGVRVFSARESEEEGSVSLPEPQVKERCSTESTTFPASTSGCRKATLEGFLEACDDEMLRAPTDDDLPCKGEKSFHRLLLEIAVEHRRALAEQKGHLDRQLRASRAALQQAQQKIAQPKKCLSPKSWRERERHESSRERQESSSNSNEGLKEQQKVKSVRLSPFDFCSESEEDNPRRVSGVERWMQVASILRLETGGSWWERTGSKFFDAISSLAIILNSVMIGWAANYTVISSMNGNLPDEIAQPFDALTVRDIGVGFTCWFLMEVCIRMYVSGARKYFVGEGWTWNLFDIVVVCGDIVQSILEISQNSEGFIAMQNLTVVRMLRILRITRALRILRLVRFFRELRMMVFSILRSGSSLLWSLVLLSVTIYAFAVYFIQIVAYHMHFVNLNPGMSGMDEKDLGQLRAMFGNLLRAEYTLYMAVSGGISWGEITRLLIEVDVLHGVVFCFYTFFTTFALLNIITGIFVETSISSARSGQEELAQEQLYMTKGLMDEMKKFFEEADRDKSGTINLAEFEVYLGSKEVRAYLDALGIEIDKARSLFNLLDMDMSGEITVEEFTFGCLRLKGGAKSIDLATLMNHTRRMGQQWRSFFDFTESQFRQLQEFEARIEDRLGFLLDFEDDQDPGETTGGGSARTPESPNSPPLSSSESS